MDEEPKKEPNYTPAIVILSILVLILAGGVGFLVLERNGISLPSISLIRDPSCNIKGNVSQNSGIRYYHVPGMENYERTRISPEYGERWFCSEAEAIEAGWRRAPR